MKADAEANQASTPSTPFDAERTAKRARQALIRRDLYALLLSDAKDRASDYPARFQVGSGAE